MVDKNKQMKIGGQCFYPSHGVLTLVAVEVREFHGKKEEFQVLELSGGGTLLIPSLTMKNNALRPLISAAKAKELLKTIKSKTRPKLDESMDIKARLILYKDKLKEGNADDYTTIFHDLAYRSRALKITTSEERLLDTARSYFVHEVSAVLKMTPEKVLEAVSEAINAVVEVEEKKVAKEKDDEKAKAKKAKAKASKDADEEDDEDEDEDEDDEDEDDEEEKDDEEDE